MSALGDSIAPVDGRVARRQRNIDTVLGVVLELFAEDGVGVEIESHGPEPVLANNSDAIERMIRSLRFGATS